MADIISTHDIAEGEWDGQSEPSGVDTDMVATDEPTGRSIEFHVSMRDYTQRDMEALIVEAAARHIVGPRNEREIAKAIEAKCVELLNAKATKALDAVTTEIIDQPMVPGWGDKKPVTMREFLGLYGREYLSERVDRDGKPSKDSWGNNTFTRMELLVSKYIDKTFKREIETATSAAISEIQAAVRKQHQAMLDAEKTRMREAMAKLTA